MKKKILFGKDARQKLHEGAELVYRAVGSSYTPKGRLTAISRSWGFPILIADGVNIAKEVGSEDIFVDEGIKIIIEAAKKTLENAGDGTTVTTILAYHLIDKGMKMIDSGVNPSVIRKQIEAALPGLLDNLSSRSIPVKSRDDVHKIALIAANDTSIADSVTEAVEKIGEDGQITVEENKFPVMEVSYNDGLQINKGYSSPYFVTDADRMEAVYSDVAVLILDHKITTQSEALLLLEAVMNVSRQILIIGEVEGEALRVCITNKIKNVLGILVVPPPASGEKRKELLTDIAIVAGAKVIEKDDLPIDRAQFASKFQREWIGRIKTVVSDNKQTLIVREETSEAKKAEENAEIKERNKLIEERIDSLRRKRDDTKNLYDKEKYEERLAKLTTGIAVIKVGGKVDVDTREKLERTKDAVASAKACKKEGIVPGGGVIFTQLAKILESKKSLNYGEKLLYKVLQEPTKKLLYNAGEEERQDKIILEIKQKGGNFGYDVNQEKIVDLVDAGIIDATRVIKEALINASVVATKVLMTDTIICDAPEKDNMKIV